MSGGCGHTPEEHEAMKAPGIFETLTFIGYQPGDPSRGKADVEMRNIPGTECTITKPCVLTEEQRDEARRENMVKSLRFQAELAAARARRAAASEAAHA